MIATEIAAINQKRGSWINDKSQLVISAHGFHHEDGCPQRDNCSLSSMNCMPLVLPEEYNEMCECVSGPKASNTPHKLPSFTKELLLTLPPYYYIPYHIISYHTYYGTKVPKLVPFSTEESNILHSGSTT